MEPTAAGKPFSKEQVDCLDSLYRRGMTGWGSIHCESIQTAITTTGLSLGQIKNWIRRRNMKRRAEEEPDEHTPPLKQSRLTPWQQHLKNYAKTEEGKTALIDGACEFTRKASSEYVTLSTSKKDELKVQAQEAMSMERRMTPAEAKRRADQIGAKIQKSMNELETLGYVGLSVAFCQEKTLAIGTSKTQKCFTPQFIEYLHAVLIAANPPPILSTTSTATSDSIPSTSVKPATVPSASSKATSANPVPSSSSKVTSCKPVPSASSKATSAKPVPSASSKATSANPVPSASSKVTSSKPVPSASSKATSAKPVPSASSKATSANPVPSASSKVTSSKPVPSASSKATSAKPVPSASSKATSSKPVPSASSKATSSKPVPSASFEASSVEPVPSASSKATSSKPVPSASSKAVPSSSSTFSNTNNLPPSTTLSQSPTQNEPPLSPTVVISSSPLKVDADLWLSHLNLYQRDKDILESHVWLNDGIIVAAQSLLKKQTAGTVCGWQSTQCSKSSFKVVSLLQPFIQILHINDSHWVVVSNADSKEGGYFRDTVCIYDSGSPYGISRYLKEVVCSFYKNDKVDHLRFDLMNVQAQPNGYDCGVFALACATEIAHGCDPVVCCWDVDRMRHHLLTCLERGEMLRFPTSQKRNIRLGTRIRKTYKEEIFCSCRMLNDESREMIACDSCQKWFHSDCVSLDLKKSYKDCKWMCKCCDQLAHMN